MCHFFHRCYADPREVSHHLSVSSYRSLLTVDSLHPWPCPCLLNPRSDLNPPLLHYTQSECKIEFLEPPQSLPWLGLSIALVSSPVPAPPRQASEACWTSCCSRASQRHPCLGAFAFTVSLWLRFFCQTSPWQAPLPQWSLPLTITLITKTEPPPSLVTLQLLYLDSLFFIALTTIWPSIFLFLPLRCKLYRDFVCFAHCSSPLPTMHSIAFRCSRNLY